MTDELPELTDEEREAMNRCDVTEILGTWEERCIRAQGFALRMLRERDELRARLAAAEAAKPLCEWSFDYMHEKWDTTCGNAFTLSNDATIEENDMRFCPFCGGSIREKASRM